jgi:hypothetical protein
MKQVITVREKWHDLIEEISSIESSSFMSTEVDGNISVKVFS